MNGKGKGIVDAESYRVASGLSVAQAAKKAGVCCAYLRRAELHGCSFILAQRLARIYSCPIELFLYGSKGNNERTKNSRRKRNVTSNELHEAT